MSLHFWKIRYPFLFLPEVVDFVPLLPFFYFHILLYVFLFQRPLVLLHFLGSACSCVVMLPDIWNKA